MVAGYDDLLRAMNRSKPVAESFDYFVELNIRLARGEGKDELPTHRHAWCCSSV